MSNSGIPDWRSTRCKQVGGLLAAAMLALAAPSAANAAVFITRTPGAPDPGPLANETAVIDFNTGVLPNGVSLTGDWGLVTGSLAGRYGAPAGDTSRYLTVPRNHAPGSAVMMFNNFLGNSDVSNFSFYWGSIDKYNSLQLLNRTGGVLATITGAMLPPSAGSLTLPSQNQRIEFQLSGADQQLGGLRFVSSQYAFESDTFSFAKVAAVPEPSTWATMLIGFFALGAVMRVRRKPLTAKLIGV